MATTTAPFTVVGLSCVDMTALILALRAVGRSALPVDLRLALYEALRNGGVSEPEFVAWDDEDPFHTLLGVYDVVA